MQLYLIRHAQSENNALYVRTGSFDGRNPDPRLSEVGRAQARLLARFLAQGDPEAKTDVHDAFNQRGFGITHLYCSLLRRSIETALEISEAVTIPAVAHCDLHEWGGVFELVENDEEHRGLPGPNRAYFEQNYPDLILPDSLGDRGWWNKPHEPKSEAFARASRLLEDLLAQHNGTDDSVALVTHAGFFHSLLSMITEIPLAPDNDRWMTKVLFAMNNAAITRVSFYERGTVLLYLNRVDFLPRELIT
jgi:2,3-bisphosphoglycerate-dependent phosphoglycerate mutase